MRDTIPDHDAWTPRHPTELAARLKHIDRPWCVVGGWALDLWHGEETRAHEDLEFTVLRDDLPIFLAALDNLAPHAVRDGVVTPLGQGALPPHDCFQIWCLDRGAGRWRVDMMVEPGTADDWAYKRAPSFTMPRREAVAISGDGIPYLRPHLVLLFKAKHVRDKDEADFGHALPRLAPSERDLLRRYLERFHPGHSWLARL